jgi:hypothetical protein
MENELIYSIFNNRMIRFLIFEISCNHFIRFLIFKISCTNNQPWVFVNVLSAGLSTPDQPVWVDRSLNDSYNFSNIHTTQEYRVPHDATIYYKTNAKTHHIPL